MIGEPITILAFGDSLTQGYGLEQKDGFVPQLEAWLRAEGVDAGLVNAGVSGDTSAGGAARIAWSLTPEIDAVIVALGGNDLLRGIDPAATRANLSAILTETAAQELPTLLVGMEATGNYGAEYKAQFDTIYPDLADGFGVLYTPRFLEGLVVLDDPGRVLKDYMQGDAVHPNATGVGLVVEALGPAVLELVAATETR